MIERYPLWRRSLVNSHPAAGIDHIWPRTERQNPTMSTLCIKGGRIIDPANGRDAVGDLWIEDGKVCSSHSNLQGAPTYHAAGTRRRRLRVGGCDSPRRLRRMAGAIRLSYGAGAVAHYPTTATQNAQFLTRFAPFNVGCPRVPFAGRQRINSLRMMLR